jgi:hypothetical protein
MYLWTVPYTGAYVIEANGAKGGSGFSSSGTERSGGAGAYIKGTVNLTEGEVIKILVGQRGNNGSSNTSGGGGGGTFVVKNANNTPIIVAAGGNGGGTSTVAAGGNGTNSGDVGGASDTYAGGGGSFSYDGKAPATYAGKSFLSGGFGNSAGVQGGFGGGGGCRSATGSNTAVGGGGYTGGSVPNAGAGSYNAGTSQTNTAAKNTGAGSVVITYNQPEVQAPLAPNSNLFVRKSLTKDFTFTYASPIGLQSSSINIYYKKTTEGSYTSTGWISKVANSGTVITHTMPANTFDADCSYQWYVVVKDSAGATSAASAIATFNTLDSPVATPVSPIDTVINAIQPFSVTWTYSDPNSEAQSAYEVQYKNVSTWDTYTTGKITSSGTTHQFSARQIPVPSGEEDDWQWSVRVWDSNGLVGNYSAWKTFYYTRPCYASGVYTSPVISFPDGMTLAPSTVTYGVDLAETDGTISVQTRTSIDNVTWTSWEDSPHGAIIDRYFAYLQYKVTITPSSDGFTSPGFKGLYVKYPDRYYATGGWISPVLDYSDRSISTVDMSGCIASLNDGTITYETRHRCSDTDVWSEWGTAFSVINSQMQLRVTLGRSPKQGKTPDLKLLKLAANPESKKSLWFSQSIDASQAKSLIGSKAIVSSSLSTGQVIMYSRSRTTTGGTWSAWSLALSDGTLTHPADYFIQIMLVIIGDARVNELTLSLDGDASVEVLKDGLTPGAEYSFAVLDDYAIIVNGNDAPMKWDAVNPPTTLGTNPPVLSYVTTHHNKAWGVDHEAPSRVRYSNVLDPTKWDAYDFIDFNPDDGDQITAIVRYGQNMVVSKLRSMALLTGNRSSNYNVSWLDSETGAAGKNAICVADKYLVYVAQDGIRFTDLAQSIVATERLMPSWERINKRRLNQAACVYWKNKLYVALPTEGSLHNDTVWVYDFLRNCWSIIDGWEVSVWKTFNQYGEEILLCGSSVTGQLHHVDTTYYDDTVPVSFEWRSKDFNFKTPEKYKLFRNIFVDIEGTAETTNLEIDLIVDGVVTGTYRTVIEAGDGVKTTRRILPPLYGAVLGSALSLHVRGRCGIQGITIEYAVRGNIPGGDV